MAVLLAQVVGGTHQGVPGVTAVRDPSVVVVRRTSRGYCTIGRLTRETTGHTYQRIFKFQHDVG